jgi:hypothetical protein
MNEDKEKIKSLIEKLDKKSESRISKLKDIKSRFKARLENSSENSKFSLDFSLYKNTQIAKKELFSSVFTISKKKRDNNVNIILNNKIKIIFILLVLLGYLLTKYQRKKKSNWSNEISNRYKFALLVFYKIKCKFLLRF